MIDPKNVCLFVPPGLRKFKLDLFNRIARFVQAHGGQVVRNEHMKLDELPGTSIRSSVARRNWLCCARNGSRRIGNGSDGIEAICVAYLRHGSRRRRVRKVILQISR